MASETPVTEVQGEESEGKVLQAIAGEGNYYAMVIFEFTEGPDGERVEMNIRLPSNVSTGTMKAMLGRVLQELA